MYPWKHTKVKENVCFFLRQNYEISEIAAEISKWKFETIKAEKPMDE